MRMLAGAASRVKPIVALAEHARGDALGRFLDRVQDVEIVVANVDHVVQVLLGAIDAEEAFGRACCA